MKNVKGVVSINVVEPCSVKVLYQPDGSVKTKFCYKSSGFFGFDCRTHLNPSSADSYLDNLFRKFSSNLHVEYHGVGYDNILKGGVEE